MPTITKAPPERVAELAAEGMSQSSIAAALGVSRERIRQICNRDGIETTPGLVDYDTREKIAEMIKAGLFNEEIAERLGKSVAAVRSNILYIGAKSNIPYDRDRIARLRDLAAAGLSQTEAARELGMHQPQVCADAKKYGIRFVDGRSKRWTGRS